MRLQYPTMKKIVLKKRNDRFFIFLSAAGGLNAFPQQQQCFLPQAFVLFKSTAECNGACHGTGFFDADYLSEHNNMVAVTEIPIFSYCEHHMALMYNMTVSVAYLPKEKIIGLTCSYVRL